MTAVDIQLERSTSPAWIQAAAVLGGTAILLARPSIAGAFGWTIPVIVVVFATVLVLGLITPVRAGSRVRVGANLRITLSVLAAGSAVFLAGRLVSSGHAPARATALVIGLNTFAAIAEEALFRRVAFDALIGAGPVWAIFGSAALFGVAHATVYGWWAFPIDAAAGVLLGWQRWVSGSWAAPALTHAFADLLVVI